MTKFFDTQQEQKKQDKKIKGKQTTKYSLSKRRKSFSNIN
jgi:hypothetical protein